MSQLAILLEQQAEVILHRWVARVREGVAPGGESESELRDHVPELLRDLQAALSREQRPESKSVAREHGRQRYRLGFDLGALVREYGLLRDCVLDLADETDTPISRSDTRIFIDFISSAVARGVGEYTRQQQQAEQTQTSISRELAEQVRASEAQWRQVTDALPVLVSLVTLDERYGLVNKAYETWFGLPREALIGHTLREIVGEAAYAVLRPNVQRALAGERFSFEQHDVPYRLGGTRDVKVTFVPHTDPLGATAGYIALIEDITASRRLQTEREVFTRQRTEVLESMGDAFCAIDDRWRFTIVNRRYEQVSGKSRAEILGRVVWDLFPQINSPDSPYFQHYHRCMSERVEVQFVDHSSALDRWTDVRAYPTADGGISVFFRDVSVEKRAELSLKHQAEFEQQLIGIVSHDLRNPLGAILMGAKIISQQEALDERSLRIVTRIVSSGERASRLVNDLLDFTQARLGGGLQIKRRPADLDDVTRAVLDELEAAHPEREVEFRTSGHGQGDWDADRLAQVVQNLVTNALKYSSPGSVVRVRVASSEQAVSLTVHNEGAPIPAVQIEHLFQPMQRGPEQLTSTSRSVGLGLYIVKHIVDAHGGSIEVVSSADAGTTFTVTLPRRAPSTRLSE